MKVKVTLENIKNGRKQDSFNCAIACALKDLHCEYPDVCDSNIEFRLNDKSYKIETPAEVADWIFEFDKGKTVNPFEFELDI